MRTNPELQKEIKLELALIETENMACISYYLKQQISKNIVNEEVPKVIGQTIVEYEGEIEEMDMTITDLKKTIGDNVISERVIKKSKEKTKENKDITKLRYKQRGFDRIIKTCTKSITIIIIHNIIIIKKTIFFFFFFFCNFCC